MKLMLQIFIGFIIALPVFASDHADPIFNKKNEAGITDLFVFPEGDNIIFILGVNRGLKGQGALKLDPYQYYLHIDTDSAVTFNNAEDLLRYGGTVVTPASIKEDITFAIKLNNDASKNSLDISGIADVSGVKFWSGITDDPFIFPKFFGTNAVSMVFSIPKIALGNDLSALLVWGTSHKYPDGKQIDHVGRSLRTMNPRLDFFNELHPSKQAAAAKERHDNPGFFQKILMQRLAPMFAIRHYDIFPDVIIYNPNMPAGYPNGRKLTDDVAALACRTGDCLLWELSYADSEVWPRATENDKSFKDEFPFLADPWP